MRLDQIRIKTHEEENQFHALDLVLRKEKKKRESNMCANFLVVMSNPHGSFGCCVDVGRKNNLWTLTHIHTKQRRVWDLRSVKDMVFWAHHPR